MPIIQAFVLQAEATKARTACDSNLENLKRSKELVWTHLKQRVPAESSSEPPQKLLADAR